jgi:acyl-CoA reductase-like NAD-dependent aldehyde dehydrogenase
MTIIKMVNPATNETLGELKGFNKVDVKHAYEKARKTSTSFQNTTVSYRISEIKKIKRYIVEHMEQIVEELSKDLGKTKSEALLMEIFPVLDCIKYYEKNAEKILKNKKIRTPIALIGKKSYIFYKPLGVVLIISPWNFPFTLSLIPIISAVLAGNTVVYKPSEEAMYSATVMEKIFNESCFKKDVVTFIYGKSREISDALIEGRPDKIFLTGSATTGKKIMEQAAKYLIPVDLELGGNDPMIIFDDANIARAANAATWGSLLNCGQACVAIERIYVQHGVYDDFVKRIIHNVKKVKQGWDIKGDVDIGCVTSSNQIKIISNHIKDAKEKGAKIPIGGTVKDKFFEPTVLVNVNHSMKIMQEETFGPVLPIMRFKTEDEAIQLANDSNYGLNSSVWTADKEKALRVSERLVAGGAAINNVCTASANFALPFGGVKHSGFGRYHGPYGLHTFSNIKAVMYEKGAKNQDIQWYPFRQEKYQRFLTTFQNLFSEKTSEKIKGLPNMIKLLRSEK